MSCQNQTFPDMLIFWPDIDCIERFLYKCSVTKTHFKCNVRFVFTIGAGIGILRSVGGLNVFNHLATKRQLL